MGTKLWLGIVICLPILVYVALIRNLQHEATTALGNLRLGE